jgi:hypothetical protein
MYERAHPKLNRVLLPYFYSVRRPNDIHDKTISRFCFAALKYDY